ncbi:MAG: hypothetical protein ACOYLH_00105 [Flavobacteriales bacterium]
MFLYLQHAKTTKNVQKHVPYDVLYDLGSPKDSSFHLRMMN